MPLQTDLWLHLDENLSPSFEKTDEIKIILALVGKLELVTRIVHKASQHNVKLLS